MSKTFLGDLCAYIPKRPGQNKPFYPRVGSAFIDDSTQQISLKIDTMPVSCSGWEGWLNIYPRKEEGAQTVAYVKPSTSMKQLMDEDDDIPF